MYIYRCKKKGLKDLLVFGIRNKRDKKYNKSDWPVNKKTELRNGRSVKNKAIYRKDKKDRNN